ncbi:MAG: hypothetical protein HY738_17650 [Bacteroidia bacterium]|nr:hypothetical protein [Bacteroidia bacterium]
MMLKTILASTIISSALLFACSSDKLTSADFYLYLENPENGLVRKKNINSLTMTVKYLPPAFGVLRNHKENLSTMNYDSLLSVYKNQIVFMLSIGPDTINGNYSNITFAGISDYKNYKQRIYDLSFNIEQMVTLWIGNKEYLPVLSTLECINSLKPGSDILFVFAPVETGDKNFFNNTKIDFVFDDRIFGMGINHFVFNGDDFNNIPSITNLQI